MADKPGHSMFSSGEGYEKSTGAWSQLLAPGFVDFMQIQEGDSVLDVGCGTGLLTFAVATETLASKIVGVDPSEGFIDYARKKNDDSRVTFEKGDAQGLSFPDGSFDRCMSLLVMGFIPDGFRAVGEMKRVTKTDGTVGTVWWDFAGGMHHNHALWKADPKAREAFKGKDLIYNSADGLSSFWAKVGFRNIAVTGLAITRDFDSLDDYWLPLLQGEGPGGAYMSTLSDQRRAEVREQLRQNLLGDRRDGSFSLSARGWAVRGTVP